MKRRATIGICVAIVGSILLLFIQTSPPIQFIGGIFQIIFNGPKSVLYSLKTPSQSEIQLSLENQNLAKRLIEYEKIKRENEALRSQFYIAGGVQDNLLPARVVGSIGRLNSPHTLIIDKGKKSGVIPGASVIIGKNLIGIVGSVTKNNSQVMLITNSSFSTIGVTNNRKTQGIIRGFEDFMVFDRVIITQTLKKQDIVISRGDVNASGVGIAPDLIIGKITDINKNESQPFQTAKIVPFLDFSSLEYVFVTISQ